MEKEETKKESEKQNEENSKEELEEIIEVPEEKIDTKQFQNFLKNDFPKIPEEMQIPESKAPVLESINSPQRNNFVRLEKNLSESTSFEENKKDDNEFNYNLAGKENKEEPKYMSYENESRTFTNVQIEDLGKNSFSEKQEIEFRSSRENFESQNLEQYTPAKMQDIRNLGKENPFNKKDIKYEPGKS